MRFRQVHLDFHTSEAIAGIGKTFDKKQFQNMLKLGAVDSITIFSKCHHGWAYHPSEANTTHPGLSFDLLGAMIEAAHEIDVKTPVYISAGLDEKIARTHPEWLVRDAEDRTNWASSFMMPGYHQFCFNTPYLDILIKQVEEVVARYDADGIFLDIVGVRECYCQYCVATVRSQGGDPRDKAVMMRLWEHTYENYTKRVREAVDRIKPGLPVFHNGGHIRRGRRDLAAMNTHLELESLPTGGWGYDHFPLSARYAQTLGMNFLGMTGKFHTTWGEFGGYKHPNALRYETALSIANGACCSIGDQLHPEGMMDEATYSLIGEAYREVAVKEAWCVGATNVADIALLSVEAVLGSGESGHSSTQSGDPDAGAVRMLLEGKFLFDVVDTDADFSAYKVIILPDRIRLNGELQGKVGTFIAGGGKVLATGQSGMSVDNDDFAIDLGVKDAGVNPYRPDYYRPQDKLGRLGETAFVMYSQGRKIELADGGRALGRREDPYFNRDVFTFSSHQHTPNNMKDAGPGVVESANGIYISWEIFGDYSTKGSLICKEIVLDALHRLLPDITFTTTLPAQGIVTLQEQQAERRYINHLLYASPVRRGQNIEVIEDILPLFTIDVTLRLPQQITSVTLEPQGNPVPFTQQDGLVSYTLPQLECHQMVVLSYN